MKIDASKCKCHALTKMEVVAIVAIFALLCGLLLPWLNHARIRAQRITCCNNLMQIGLAFRLWEGDHTNLYPMDVSTNLGGTKEYISTGEVFRHFQVMSNELSTPVILVCPSDIRQSAKDFESMSSNVNISYFVGLDADDSRPENFLSGDRNITGGTKMKNGILEITTNQFVGWSSAIHNGVGNVSMADGSVRQLKSGKLNESAIWGENEMWETPDATNRLAIP